MTVHERILTVTKAYLGPAADAFLTKQCQTHIKVSSAQLTEGHIKDLATVMEIAAYRFITPDRAAELKKKVLAC